MPAFIIIIPGDFLPELLIPPAFTRKHGVFLPKKVTLKTDDESGNSWEVKIVKRNGQYWLTNGWPKFRKESRLCSSHLCVFQFVESSRIVVRIFEGGCERDDPIYVPDEHENLDKLIDISDEHENLSTHTETSSSEELTLIERRDGHQTSCNNVKLSFVWKKSMRNCMLIKGKICDELGLREETDVEVKNMKGRISVVKLFKSKDGRVGWGRGWAPLVDASNFVEGKTYQYEFIGRCEGKLQLQFSLIQELDIA